MEYRIKCYSIIENGRHTDSNGYQLQEDCLYPSAANINDNDRLFIVCDGMGGRGAGEVASSTVCQIMGRELNNTHELNAEIMHHALTEAYNALDVQGEITGRKMGTTMALLKLGDNGYTAAHIGDSRIYHIRPGRNMENTEILFRTEDHTLVNHLVKKGEMTPEEALTSPKRKVLTRAMQSKMERRCRADVVEGKDIREGDYFMLCTDGMLEYMTDDNIRAIFSADGGNDRNKVAVLSKVTGGNADNHSAIIIHILGVYEEQKRAERKLKFDDVPYEMDCKPIEPIPIQATTSAPKTASKTAPLNDQTMRHKANIEPASTVIFGLRYIKIASIVIAIVTVMMLVYYLFLHHNESLQEAGTAIDKPVELPSFVEEEKYGYEITEQDIRNEALEIAPEEDTTTDEGEYTDETVNTENENENENTNSTASEPQTPTEPQILE